MDFGFLGPPETDSSDEEMYIGARPDTEPDPARVESSNAASSRFKYQKLPSTTKLELFEVGVTSQHCSL